MFSIICLFVIVLICCAKCRTEGRDKENCRDKIMNYTRYQNLKDDLREINSWRDMHPKQKLKVHLKSLSK